MKHSTSTFSNKLVKVNWKNEFHYNIICFTIERDETAANVLKVTRFCLTSGTRKDKRSVKRFEACPWHRELKFFSLFIRSLRQSLSEHGIALEQRRKARGRSGCEFQTSKCFDIEFTAQTFVIRSTFERSKFYDLLSFATQRRIKLDRSFEIFLLAQQEEE